MPAISQETLFNHMPPNLLKTLCGLAIALLISSGCSSPAPRPTEVKDGPPGEAREDLAHLPDPVPKQEPRSRYGNPEMYSVFGQTYRLLNSADGYSVEGNASWYGSKFHGRRTSSGETYDMYMLTAAHKTLPIPTYARVTNLANNRTTVVRINDRGPFHADRVIDLSYAAAVKLGFAHMGTARVKVEVIDLVQDFMLQAGAFQSLDSADRLQRNLEQLTGVRAYVVRTPEDNLYRVRLGPIRGESEAQRLRDMISAQTGSLPLMVGH
ncbi:MAG: septal ring lytic transglycosylase RlpA family protein [Proteobacteria bacterium]|nr:septal ring lytic transglycosylase RlpA family protein [Pseudomonadota bacterium]